MLQTNYPIRLSSSLSMQIADLLSSTGYALPSTSPVCIVFKTH
jgi:hypothetical protein